MTISDMPNNYVAVHFHKACQISECYIVLYSNAGN